MTVKSALGATLTVVVAAAFPCPASGSPSGHIDFAIANAEGTHVSFAGSVSYDVCEQRTSCLWSAEVVVQPYGDECYRSLPQGASTWTVVASIAEQSTDGTKRFEGSDVTMLPCEGDQALGILLRDRGFISFSQDPREFPWPGACEANAPLAITCTTEERFICPLDRSEYDSDERAAASALPRIEDASPDPPDPSWEFPYSEGLAAMHLDYTCGFWPHVISRRQPAPAAGPPSPFQATKPSTSGGSTAGATSVAIPAMHLSRGAARFEAKRALRLRYGFRYRLGANRKLDCKKTGIGFRCTYRFRYAKRERKGLVRVRRAAGGSVFARVRERKRA